MSTNQIIADPDQLWHDPAFVREWEAHRRRGGRAESNPASDSILDFSILSGVALSQDNNARVCARAIVEHMDQFACRDGESLTDRARRLEGKSSRGERAKHARSSFRPPELIAKHRGEWSITPLAHKARPEKLAKAKALYERGLTAKAQRELACGLLAGEVRCRNGHRFYVHYRCGHRYCLECGPQTARRLFAKHLPRVQPVADVLLAKHPDYVIAKLDFTRRKPCAHRGKCDCPMPAPEYNRDLNISIRRLCRAIERKFGIGRVKYGMAVHDEIGNGNTNAHAHAGYIGPYIPQRWLAMTWRKICRDGSFIISIKRTNSVAAALRHATKYPGKFVRESTPERLAELELSYHRVRRFRLLGAFDKRVSERIVAGADQTEPRESSDLLDQVVSGSSHAGHCCPYCDAPLKRLPGWRDLNEMLAMNVPSLDVARQQIARTHGLGGTGPPTRSRSTEE